MTGRSEVKRGGRKWERQKGEMKENRANGKGEQFWGSGISYPLGAHIK